MKLWLWDILIHVENMYKGKSIIYFSWSKISNIYSKCLVRFLFNIYFFKDALVYKFKYQWCAWFFHILYHTKSSISAIFRTHPTLVSPSPVLSTPQWETSISSCLPRSQYISLFSVFIANITGLFNLINFLNSKNYLKVLFILVVLVLNVITVKSLEFVVAQFMWNSWVPWINKSGL